MINQHVISIDPEKFKVINLSDYTTWGIGGPSASVVVRTENELVDTVGFLNEESIPWIVLGRGSNMLAPTEGWSGVVIFLKGHFSEYFFKEERLTAGGGAHLPSVAGAACTKGLAGLVFAVGIPGTIGGAVYMNAGAYGSSISDFVEKVRVFHSNGLIEYLTPEECGFKYRFSSFQKSDSIVLSAELKLFKNQKSSKKLRREVREILQLRRLKFPLHAPNAGSVFRRPDFGPPPGKLIEDNGLKGYTIGGAMVSRVHANFIENTGRATSSDVMNLIELIINEVEKASGITLVREIRKLGEQI